MYQYATLMSRLLNICVLLKLTLIRFAIYHFRAYE
jgi:hypothetical protein